MSEKMKQQRYPKGHPHAGQFISTGRVDVRRLRSILRSAIISTDPEVQAVLDEFRAINPDATKRRRREGEPIPAESLTLHGGEIVDEVFSFGRPFSRRRDGFYPSDRFEMIRFQFDQPVTDEEIVHSLQIIGYAWRQNIAGDPLERAERDGTHSFVVWAPARTSTRTHVRNAVRDFEIDLPEYFESGSPVRKSNRIDRATGKSMKGTRLVEGLGRKIVFETYYDDVTAEPFEPAED